MTTTDKVDNWGVAFKSEDQTWATPYPLFKKLDDEFNFTLDVCATEETTKVPHNYITPEVDALTTSWNYYRMDGSSSYPHPNVCFMNPPYGREVGDWIKRAYEMSNLGCTVVCLTFVRSDTKWWREWAMKASEIRFIESRVKF